MYLTACVPDAKSNLFSEHRASFLRSGSLGRSIYSTVKPKANMQSPDPDRVIEV